MQAQILNLLAELRREFRQQVQDLGTEWVAQIRTTSTIEGPYQLQEDGHASYWGQLAMRNCLRLAYNNGAVRGGKCVRVANGLNGAGEPQMGLQ